MDKKLLASALLVLAAASFAQTNNTKRDAFTLPPRAAGNRDAPIVLEVFSDFQCPHCRELYLRTLRRVMDDYVPGGRVYLIHRDFPIDSLHKYAREAARWANASAVIGKYETVAEALFTKQDAWGATGDIQAAVAEVLSPAELQRVKQIMSTRMEVINSAIESDMFMGHQINLTETPTTKIVKGGKTISITAGAVQYAILKKYLDDQLSK